MPKPALRIERATPADAPAIAELLHEAFDLRARLSQRKLPAGERPARLADRVAERERALKAFLEGGRGFGLVARTPEGEVKGYVGALQHLEFFNLASDSKAQAGRLLVRAVQREAHELGAPEVRFEAANGKVVLRFYALLGAKPIGPPEEWRSVVRLRLPPLAPAKS